MLAALTIGPGLSAAVSQLGLKGVIPNASPVWGHLIRFAYRHFDGDAASVLTAVSVLSAVVAFALFAYAIHGLIALAAQRAELGARPGECACHHLALPAALCALVSFVAIPAFWTASLTVGPLMTALALAMLVPAILVFLARQDCSRAPLVTALGFVAAVAGLEGLPGLCLLPFAFVLLVHPLISRDMRLSIVYGLFLIGLLLGVGLVLRMDISRFAVPHVSWDPALAGWLLFVLTPVVILWALVVGHRLGILLFQRVFFGAWVLLAILLVTIGVFAGLNRYSTAEDHFVQRMLADAGARTWLVSDGVFDDILLLRKSPDAHLVTFARLYDASHGREIVQWVGESHPHDEDLIQAAEFGPANFLEVWFAHYPEDSASQTHVCTIAAPNYADLPPTVWGWHAPNRAVDWSGLEAVYRSEWARVDGEAPANSLSRAWLARFFSAQANAIGLGLWEKGDCVAAWNLLTFVADTVDGENIAVLFNILELGRQLGTAYAEFLPKYETMLAEQMTDVRTLDILRYRLSWCGHVRKTPHVQELLRAREEAARRAFAESAFGRKLNEGFDRIEAANRLSGDAREEAFDEIERTILPSLERLSAEGDNEWIARVFYGDVELSRGGPRHVARARSAFRALAMDDRSEHAVVYDRLLLADGILGEPHETELDALIVLRHNATNQLANAMLGSARLKMGDYESAERYLRRALTFGPPLPGIKRDYALALSWLGQREMAIRYAREAAAESPDDPNMRHALSTILEKEE